MSLFKAFGFALLAVATVYAHTAWANVLSVGPHKSCRYADLQAAIDDLAENDVIAVESGLYPAEHLSLANVDAQTFSIVGKIDCASGTPTEGETVLTTALGSIHAAIEFADRRYNVQLSDLTLSGARAEGCGGGMRMSSVAGVILLRGVKIVDNRAIAGAGICVQVVEGNPGAFYLVLLDGTLISGNVAEERGGGIYVNAAGSALNPLRLFLTAGNSAVASNQATDGAGLYIGGATAIADVAAHGYLLNGVSLPAIGGNFASHAGGGMAVEHGAQVRLFSNTPGVPVRIERNGLSAADDSAATEFGGAIYASSGGRVCGWNYRLDGNTARAGAAVFARDADVALLPYDAGERCGPRPVGPALDCREGTSCNAIDDNRAIGPFPISGIVDVGRNGRFDAARVELLRNSGNALLVTQSATTLRTCLIAGNDAGETPYLLANFDASLSLEGCTLADNTFGPASADHALIEVDGAFEIRRSILWQSNFPSLNAFSGPISAEDVIASDDRLLQLGMASGMSVVPEPGFIDSTRNDYHVRLDSPAVNYSNVAAPGDLDLDSRPRGIDGRVDVGAYEAIGADTIFSNGFD